MLSFPLIKKKKKKFCFSNKSLWSSDFSTETIHLHEDSALPLHLRVVTREGPVLRCQSFMGCSRGDSEDFLVTKTNSGYSTMCSGSLLLTSEVKLPAVDLIKSPLPLFWWSFPPWATTHPLFVRVWLMCLEYSPKIWFEVEIFIF